LGMQKQYAKGLTFIECGLYITSQLRWRMKSEAERLSLDGKLDPFAGARQILGGWDRYGFCRLWEKGERPHALVRPERRLLWPGERRGAGRGEWDERPGLVV
jgi:hypothetical protein